MPDNNEFVVSAMENDKKKKKQPFFKTRGFKYGSLATALTAALIVAVIAANMLLTALSDNYSWALDFTSTGMYKISDAAKQVVNSLSPDTKIEITVFYAEESFPDYVKEPLKRFCNLSDNITYKYIDPEKNPTALVQYGEEYKVSSASVVLKCGNRIRVFDADDYVEGDSDTGVIKNYLEERLTAGILYVTKDEIPMVYFLTGHGEDGYSSFMNLIANNGADVKELNLLTDTKIDDNAKLMVICNPQRDYSASEIRIISDFANNGNKLGRNIMYFSSNSAYKLPNLENFIREWGIEFGNDKVLDSTYCYNNNAYNVIPELTTEKIFESGPSLSTEVWQILPNSRSLNILFAENDMYKTQKLVTSYADSSYSKSTDDMSNVTEKLDADKSGPFTLSALTAKVKYLNNDPVYSYMLVNGSADMLNEFCVKYSGNGEYLMQIYKMMVNEQDDTIVSAQKSTSSTVMTLSSTQTNVMTAIVLIVFPLIFLIIGFIVFIRRRFL